MPPLFTQYKKGQIAYWKRGGNNIRKYIPIISVIFIFSILGVVVGNTIFAQDNVSVLLISGKADIRPIIRQSMEPIYPGHCIKSTLKIVNDLDVDTALKNIGMNIRLKRNSEDLDISHVDAKDYMKYVSINIDYKDPLKNLIKGNIFKGSFSEFVLGKDINIPIEKKTDLELEFTIGMNKEAKVNVEGIESLIDFIFKIDQYIGQDKENREDSKSEFEKNKVLKEDENIEVHWAHNCITALLNQGIIQGYEDGSIRPENMITRAEASVVVGKALGLREIGDENSKYADRLPSWAKGYILALTEKGVLEGYDDRQFRPDQYITREEMTKVLILAFNKKMNSNLELEFTDREDIGSWALEYVKSGVSEKIIEGYADDTFRPKNNITRAEAFTIICKLLGLHNTHLE